MLIPILKSNVGKEVIDYLKINWSKKTFKMFFLRKKKIDYLAW